MTNKSELPQPENNSKQSVEFKIRGILQDVAVMGANDYEIPAINAVLEKLQSDEYSPEEALEKAQKIIEGKADYH